MYNLLVKDYQVTELTFQEDVLHAFAGITTRLCSSFAGGFNYGISELFFDDGLLWQPNGSMARRFGVNARGEDTPLPSWSWMGWHVQMDQLSIQRGCEYMKRSSLGSFDLANIHKLSTQQRTTTLVQWYILKKFTNQKRAISNNSKQYLYCLEENAELPSGWRRHKTLPQPLLPLHHPTQIHPYFVDHERLQGAQVWYPIPLVGSDAVPSLQEQSHLLWCHTQRAWLTAHYVPFTRNKWLPARKMQEIFYSTLKDETGSWAGILTMHEEVITGEQGISCEFVAISKGYCSKASDTYDLEECRWDWLRFEDENQPYEWYNVLWVEWVDGVAYRKGLGRVPKEVWERQDLEWIDLTLG